MYVERQKICTIHQPEHLPWLGFWHKLFHADIYVILDSVQFKRRHFENRNKIRNKDRDIWITVPIKQAPRDTLISDIEISYNENWQDKNLKSIYHCYNKTPYFDQIFPSFEKIYRQKHKFLADFNFSLIEFVLDISDFELEIVRSSKLDVVSKASQLILDICNKVKAGVYLSGQSGKEYLILDDFKRNHIEVKFQEFELHEYPQIGSKFIPNLSVIDFLFNCGGVALKKYLMDLNPYIGSKSGGIECQKL